MIDKAPRKDRPSRRDLVSCTEFYQPHPPSHNLTFLRQEEASQIRAARRSSLSFASVFHHSAVSSPTRKFPRKLNPTPPHRNHPQPRCPTLAASLLLRLGWGTTNRRPFRAKRNQPHRRCPVNPPNFATRLQSTTSAPPIIAENHTIPYYSVPVVKISISKPAQPADKGITNSFFSIPVYLILLKKRILTRFTLS